MVSAKCHDSAGLHLIILDTFPDYLLVNFIVFTWINFFNVNRVIWDVNSDPKNSKET